VPRTASKNYKVIYSFGAAPDGNYPVASLLNVGGTLYGTTSEGGSNTCEYSPSVGCGTVFRITKGGTENVVYSFARHPDGNFPAASLIDVRGTLYGTTQYAGSHYCGTVFSLTLNGMEKVLHSFGRFPDGCKPEASLVDVKGTLYGTTSRDGGKHKKGVVFSVTPDGAEKVLHSFGGRPDGAYPAASLVEVKSTLYGTTSGGGVYGDSLNSGGIVFTITPDGTEKALYSFRGEADPVAPLIAVKGNLYGTTWGGASDAGTIFSVTLDGKEKVLHRFRGGSDGAHPAAGLIDVGGTLYGTTQYGGSYSCQFASYSGCGTVFSITPGGKEKVLHSFGNGSDGETPLAGLVNINGTLYGTTSAGGTYGNGTVFALTLPSGS